MLDLLRSLRAYGIVTTIKCKMNIHHLDLKIVKIDKKAKKVLKCDYCNYRKELP